MASPYTLFPFALSEFEQCREQLRAVIQEYNENWVKLSETVCKLICKAYRNDITIQIYNVQDKARKGIGLYYHLKEFARKKLFAIPESYAVHEPVIEKTKYQTYILEMIPQIQQIKSALTAIRVIYVSYCETQRLTEIPTELENDIRDVVMLVEYIADMLSQSYSIIENVSGQKYFATAFYHTFPMRVITDNLQVVLDSKNIIALDHKESYINALKARLQTVQIAWEQAVHEILEQQRTLKNSNSITHSTSSSFSQRAQDVTLIPHTLLQYTDKDILGRGAQGVVYKAQWSSRHAVFKKLFLQNHNSHEEQALKEFFYELEVWKKICHPNSVELYGAVRDSGTVGYVMEHCPNGNLYDQMKKGIVLGPTKTIDLICGIADIISNLHHSHIAHRDIKSANIMLDHEFHPKLGDFGLSRKLDTTQASATNLKGTFAYMAPEQFIANAKHISVKADVYSFGMLMYELATNKAPFAGKSQFEIYEIVKQGERPKVQPDLPPGMEDDERALWWKIVKQCWAQDPLSRPPMREVSQKLNGLRNQIFSRMQGFRCKQHISANHHFFLSYRVGTESNTVQQLFDLLTQEKRKSGESINVFLDAKCLPNAEDWRKSFLYGLYHSEVIVPVVSSDSLQHFHKAHEENDNVLLEYEHMLSFCTYNRAVKVFPIFIDDCPLVESYPDKPHITTGQSIRNTLQRIVQLKGLTIKRTELAAAVPALLAKLEEIQFDTVIMSDLEVVPQVSGGQMDVFVQVEGEPIRENSISVHLSASLERMRKQIEDELDDFDFKFKFLKIGPRTSVITLKQEAIKTVADIVDTNANITVRRS